VKTLPPSRHRFALVLCASFAIAGILATANQISAWAVPEMKTSGAAPSIGRERPAAWATRSIFAGIPQQGAVLGSPMARVTLVEYADLRCPYCGQWARETLPVLVREYVKTGKLRIVFNGLAFLGPDSVKALRTVLAAGREDRLWDLVHGLYVNQGAENPGWVTDELVKDLASHIQGLHRTRTLDARRNHAFDPEIRRAAAAAEAAGVSGTPAFQVGPTGGQLQTVQLTTLASEGLVPAIEAVLAQ
jgi:protein-disulfide isomerase